MSVFDKARELADTILASEESCRLADAKTLAENGQISNQELNAAITDYNTLINDAMEIVRESLGISDGCKKRGCAHKGG